MSHRAVCGSKTMLALKYFLMILGVGLFGSASALIAYDIFLSEQLRRLLSWREKESSRARRKRANGAGKNAGVSRAKLAHAIVSGTGLR